MTPGSLLVASVCTYSFQFQISNPVPHGGKVSILFPSLSISVPAGLSSAQVTVTAYGTEVKSFTVSVQSNAIQISNAFGGALASSSTQYIVITIANVQNPLSMAQSPTFKIATLDASGYTIDSIYSGLTVQMTLPS